MPAKSINFYLRNSHLFTKRHSSGVYTKKREKAAGATLSLPNRPLIVRYAPPRTAGHPLKEGLTKPPTSCPPTLLESDDLPQQSLGSTSSNTSARFVRFGSLALSLPNVSTEPPLAPYPLLLMPRQQPRCVPLHSHTPVVLNRSAHIWSFLGASVRASFSPCTHGY